MSRASVLVVDDDSSFLHAVNRILLREGYEVLPSGSPHQALETIRNVGPVDLVLSDIMMPNMPDTELVRQIAEFSPRTASVLMTGGCVDATALPNGVPVLKKPFSTH